MRHAIPKVSPGGVLVLDNSERPRYQAAINRGTRTVRSDLNFLVHLHRPSFSVETTIWVVPQDPPEPS